MYTYNSTMGWYVYTYTYITQSRHQWGLIEQGLTSHQTHYRSYRGRFLQVIRPNQQCQSTEGSQLVFQIRLESHKHHSVRNNSMKFFVIQTNVVQLVKTAHSSRPNVHCSQIITLITAMHMHYYCTDWYISRVNTVLSVTVTLNIITASVLVRQMKNVSAILIWALTSNHIPTPFLPLLSPYLLSTVRIP